MVEGREDAWVDAFEDGEVEACSLEVESVECGAVRELRNRCFAWIWGELPEDRLEEEHDHQQRTTDGEDDELVLANELEHVGSVRMRSGIDRNGGDHIRIIKANPRRWPRIRMRLHVHPRPSHATEGFVFCLAVEFDDEVGVHIEWDLVLGWERCDLRVEFRRVEGDPAWDFVSAHGFHVLADDFLDLGFDRDDITHIEAA